METLYGVARYAGSKVADEATKEAAKKLVVQPLFKRIFGPDWDKDGDAAIPPKVDFSEKLIEYLQRQDRALETTLRCLDQLVERVDMLGAAPTRNPILVAVGLTSDIENVTQQASGQIEQILNDQTPGLPQSIKSGYALLHLRRGNLNLARIYAKSTLKTNPVEAKAWYVLGLLKLQQPISAISPQNADDAEQHLATAAEAGLSAQCALPRAALRVDHYLPRKRKEPAPGLSELALLYGRRLREADSWPYGLLNNRVPTSREFKDIWFDSGRR